MAVSWVRCASSRASWADATFCFALASEAAVWSSVEVRLRFVSRTDRRSARRMSLVALASVSRVSWASASLTALRAWVSDRLFDALVSL